MNPIDPTVRRFSRKGNWQLQQAYKCNSSHSLPQRNSARHVACRKSLAEEALEVPPQPVLSKLSVRTPPPKTELKVSVFPYKSCNSDTAVGSEFALPTGFILYLIRAPGG